MSEKKKVVAVADKVGKAIEKNREKMMLSDLTLNDDQLRVIVEIVKDSQ